MRSSELRSFERRYKELRRQFLPRNFSRTGSYSDAQFTGAAAFRLLFHSELESFLEGLALSVLDEIDTIVRAGGNCRGASAVMCLYKPDVMGGMPSQFSEIEARAFLKRVQLACIHELRTKIGNNRGVKTYNLLSMYVPLGVDETVLDEQFLIDLSTLGARRGDVAHKGLNTVTSLPDPREEKILAERIIQSLQGFESLLPRCVGLPL